ncbi:cytochrome c1 [Hoeflea sp.]|uniref:cytochrome c1 n=1 Tax=Hoeflea sp. TaxID=1940281 RepID=UPI00199C55FD|nr:cytochrome c1 [Hoeflea sp.]MBC7281383.1 cytochrome c1 [Hoeflea sp.]
MNKFVTSIALIAAIATTAMTAARAEDGHDLATAIEHAQETGHYPLLKPKNVDWSFAGLFGKYDKAQLQRGLKVYSEVCSACHSMNLVPFRTLEDLGYSEDQVKSFAANYEVEDGPNAEGEMFTRPAIPADHFPSPFPNAESAAYANNGAAPPDVSMIAKARGVERGFPTFITDIFTQYQEGGPDYIYSLLTGYQEPPEGYTVADGNHFNPYFVGGTSLAMAKPIDDGFVTYDDGSPETLDQYAKDVSAFLMWAAEPHLEDRKSMGFMVLMFLALFTVLMYLTKKAVFANQPH